MVFIDWMVRGRGIGWLSRFFPSSALFGLDGEDFGQMSFECSEEMRVFIVFGGEGRIGLDWTRGMDSQPNGWLSESGTRKRGRGRNSQDKEHGEEPKTVRDKEHGESPFAVITYGLEGDNSNSSSVIGTSFR